MREAEFEQAVECLNPRAETELWHFHDGNVWGKYQDVVHRANAVLRELNPDVVISPWSMDMHPDHSALGYAVLEAVMLQKNKPQVYFWEVWSAVPLTHVLDISKWWHVKVKALSFHKTALSDGGGYFRVMEAMGATRSVFTKYNGNDGGYGEGYSLWDEIEYL